MLQHSCTVREKEKDGLVGAALHRFHESYAKGAHSSTPSMGHAVGQAFPGLGNYRQIQKHSIRYSVI